jgi:hypothetical protein
MKVADKYNLVAQSLRLRASTPEALQHRVRLLGLAEQFDQVSLDAAKEDWSDIDAPTDLAA